MRNKLLVGLSIIAIVYMVKPLLSVSTHSVSNQVSTPTPFSKVTVSPSPSSSPSVTPIPTKHSIIRPGDGGEGAFDN